MFTPTQAILIPGDALLWNSIMHGNTKTWLKPDHYDYRPGAVLLGCSELNICLEASLMTVTHTVFERIGSGEMLSLGYLNLDVAVAGFRKYYPDIQRNSPVTVLWWDTIQGYALNELI